MPTTVSRKTQTESRKFRRLVAEYLRLNRAKRPSPAREQSLQREIKRSLEYLDNHAILVGNSKAEVAALLGPAPGQAGPESWLYPGGSADESYRIDFQSGAVARKSFEIIYAS
jgi:hypothetical protein